MIGQRIAAATVVLFDVCVSSLALGGEAVELSVPSSFPPEAREAFSKFPSSKQYVFVSRVTPFYLQGDFNDDGKTDTAVLVKQKTTNKVGIAVVHGGSQSVTILGAGRNFGNGGDSFTWMDAWRVYRKGAVARGASESEPPTLKGDGILVIKTMSASALVYWTGEDYGWYQQGD